ncbi:hypothetical protein GLYMA_15G032600v4 [Glycine max]|uniref:Uncharacterized protein n=1 Tax=Glycine max TaxID=3847 RepID=A0A0R0FV84_SOYBN|nr:hypothetical protein JHK85_041925 [Glycine max]KAH1145333.1 hypothetical protein GYH30_041205 [Glycine max]KRH10174.1 hypothetical protein GLYMA_15G032600v4 [Glycine max]
MVSLVIQSETVSEVLPFTSPSFSTSRCVRKSQFGGCHIHFWGSLSQTIYERWLCIVMMICLDAIAIYHQFGFEYSSLINDNSNDVNGNYNRYCTLASKTSFLSLLLLL